MISFVVTHSDMTVSEMLAAKAVEPDAPALLYEFGTQFPSIAKFPMEARSKEVCAKASAQRLTDPGCRLKDFKARGCFKMADRQLDFDVYVPKFGEDLCLQSVLHTPSKIEVDVPGPTSGSGMIAPSLKQSL